MGPRPVKSARHLTDFEALMWTLESDPLLRSGFANITLLDQPVDVAHFKKRMERAAVLIPQLRKRVVPSVLRIAPPSWEVDPDFRVDHHVRAVTLPAPGTLDQLAALAMEFTMRPYDEGHPLWEFLCVDGLADGRGAMIQRMHHIITDGVGAVRMSEQFIDLTRATPDVIIPPIADGDDQPTEPTNRLATTVNHAARRNFGMMQRTVRATIDLGLHPTNVPAKVNGAGKIVQSIAHEVTDQTRRQSPLWTKRSLDHAFFMLRIPLDAVKDVAKRFGTTVNDVFVTGAAGGAGAYHRAKGADVRELRMAMPVNVRSDKSAAGNAFSMARVMVPVGEDPAERLVAVHELLGSVRQSSTVSAVQSLAGLANLLPPAVVLPITRRQVETIDFTTSNVRGAPIPVYVAGARVESNHPIGPLAGTAFNLTTLGYCDMLDMGLHIDRGAISDPALLRDCIRDAFDALLAL